MLTKREITHLEKLSPQQLKKYGLTRAALQKLKIAADPVRWVCTNLRDPENPKKPFVARPMQEELIALRHPKIAIRASRRTGKSVGIAARMIHQAFTESNIPILLVAPYVAQVKEVFDDIDRLIEQSPTVAASMVRQVKSPFYEIELGNRSVIRGMCAGSTPGRRGSSLRGQGAKYLYVDEFDYMDEESLNALFMITKSRKDTELFVTGTPSGVRSWFYRWCTTPEKYAFIAKHYGKDHIINWTDEDEFTAREILTEAGYRHEVLGEFADESTQVFATEYIDACLANYEPKDLKWNPNRQYGIGVDWNSSKTGCHIVIMEYLSNDKPDKDDQAFLSTVHRWRADRNKQYREKLYERLEWNHFHKKLRVFRHIAVSGEPFAQHEAVNAIIQAYRTYHPKFIWVDQGHGEVQVEILLKWALANGDKNLPKILKACSFAGTIEIADPIKPSRMIKKRFKPYMVQTMQRYLESAEFVFPISYDDKNALVGQLRAYTVEKHTMYNEPVYSSGNDHILDATMLAVMGFEHNFGLLTGKRRRVPGTNLVHKPGHRTYDVSARDYNPAEKVDDGHKVVTNRDEFFRDKKSPAEVIKIHFGKLRIPFKRWIP